MYGKLCTLSGITTGNGRKMARSTTTPWIGTTGVRTLSDKTRGKLEANHDIADHCIDELRQALMCHVDITPLTHGLEATHQSRNFTKIQQWAELRKVNKPSN